MYDMISDHTYSIPDTAVSIVVRCNPGESANEDGLLIQQYTTGYENKPRIIRLPLGNKTTRTLSTQQFTINSNACNRSAANSNTTAAVFSE